MKLALPHGLTAELIEGEPTVIALPPKPAPARRWSKNGHLWEECGCGECAGRRKGLIDPGENYRPNENYRPWPDAKG